MLDRCPSPLSPTFAGCARRDGRMDRAAALPLPADSFDDSFDYDDSTRQDAAENLVLVGAAAGAAVAIALVLHVPPARPNCGVYLRYRPRTPKTALSRLLGILDLARPSLPPDAGLYIGCSAAFQRGGTMHLRRNGMARKSRRARKGVRGRGRARPIDAVDPERPCDPATWLPWMTMSRVRRHLRAGACTAWIFAACVSREDAVAIEAHCQAGIGALCRRAGWIAPLAKDATAHPGAESRGADCSYVYAAVYPHGIAPPY